VVVVRVTSFNPVHFLCRSSATVGDSGCTLTLYFDNVVTNDTKSLEQHRVKRLQYLTWLQRIFTIENGSTIQGMSNGQEQKNDFKFIFKYQVPVVDVRL
jgi:hypothetical protein